MSANLKKIQTALEACRLALGKVQCVKSVAWEPSEVTVEFQPGHERELALIDDALAELDQVGEAAKHSSVEVRGMMLQIRIALEAARVALAKGMRIGSVTQPSPEVMSIDLESAWARELVLIDTALTEQDQVEAERSFVSTKGP